MKTFWKVIGAAVLALAFLGSYSLASMLLDREPPIRYEDARAVSPAVEQGGTVDVQFTVFRSRICPVVTRRWLYDAADEKHSIPQFTVGLQMLAGRETYRRSITVPSTAAVGPARYVVNLEYTCNLLQNLVGPIKVTSPPIRFMVTPAASLLLRPDGGGDG